MLQRNIEDVDAAAKTIVHRLQEAGPGCDFVTACAAWLPVKIICDMMGIPESQHEFVFDMTNIILSQGDPEFVPEGQNRSRRSWRRAALAGLIDDIAGQADGSDGDTLTHALVNAEIDGDKLTREEIQSFFVLLCTAATKRPATRSAGASPTSRPTLSRRHCSRAISTPTCPAPWRKSSGTQAR